MENLPDARGIFACDAQNHVEEFVQTERLPHHRPHGYVSGLLFRVTDRNRFGQCHDGSIRGERLKSRYEKEIAGRNLRERVNREMTLNSYLSTVDFQLPTSALTHLGKTFSHPVRQYFAVHGLPFEAG